MLKWKLRIDKTYLHNKPLFKKLKQNKIKNLIAAVLVHEIPNNQNHFARWKSLKSMVQVQNGWNGPI